MWALGKMRWSERENGDVMRNTQHKPQESTQPEENSFMRDHPSISL
jgi:hypothetical protein